MEKSKRIQQIEEMEKILDEHSLVIERFRAALQEFKASQKNYEKLKNYYINGEYLSDMDAYSRGELPKGLKCGVLSEDAVYNLLGDNYTSAIEMLETATEIIKKH
ncbi:MAG: DUF4298 domain-containing protein [Eubacteriales bacterium]|nr:DUF4298 domain-containing protein [Eubacteriales bacterium]